ncbi:MAG TPA: thioredoxin-dependent thiol peroxidase [Gemmatimonadales bacterium]|nr:thioredoxin-dependent thiol peroxidase [Gemmatimonadales bacterium]
MLTIGSKAPAFSLPADTGETIRLADLKGKKVVLYFYPKDDTSGCTTEACEFRDSWADVKKTGAIVLGVSPDDLTSHEKFRRKHHLPFPLLADVDHAVAERYDSWGEKSMYGRKYFGILRNTFIIDAEGRIAQVFTKVKPKGHAEQVLAALRNSGV